MIATLVLRDVHVPATPSWWPLAPGWWLLLAAIVVLLAVPGWFGWRRRRRLRAWEQVFQQACNGEAPAQVAAISGLLRRASRRTDARADKWQGEAWLAFLDGNQGHAFSQGPGRLLLEGGYRPQVDEQALQELKALALPRFLSLMGAR